jgi:hypothetical protein
MDAEPGGVRRKGNLAATSSSNALPSAARASGQIAAREWRSVAGSNLLTRSSPVLSSHHHMNRARKPARGIGKIDRVSQGFGIFPQGVKGDIGHWANCGASFHG